MKSFKSILFAIACAFSLTASACWYQLYSYEDYIVGVNNFERHSTVTITNADSSVVTAYKVRNNMVVDFPITVTMKLISNSPVKLTEDSKPEILSCMLQYRVLPSGNWVTVEKYEAESGTIPATEPPMAYLGRNNINPKGCKRGDAIMIRLYVTDGTWNSGSLSSRCDKLLKKGNCPAFPDTVTLEDEYSYYLKSHEMHYWDLGGYWLPHLCFTVIYSGETRPER